MVLLFIVYIGMHLIFKVAKTSHCPKYRLLQGTISEHFDIKFI